MVLALMDLIKEPDQCPPDTDARNLETGEPPVDLANLFNIKGNISMSRLQFEAISKSIYVKGNNARGRYRCRLGRETKNYSGPGKNFPSWLFRMTIRFISQLSN